MSINPIDVIPSIPRYSITRRLGSGGFAVVYAGRRDADGAESAIKIATHLGDRRFAREAMAMQRVGPPVAPTLYETGVVTDNRPYIVMELVHGVPVSTWLEEFRTRSLAQRIAVGIAITRAVETMHQRGFIHRDLKPANVIMRLDAPESLNVRVTLLDFGLAKPHGGNTPPGLEDFQDLTAAGTQVGTMLYMSPEQCDGKPADTRSDIYTLGVILFELLVGRPPFDGDTSALAMAHTSRRPPLPSRVAGTPAAFDAIVLRCLAKLPDDRFPDALGIAAALEAAVATGVLEQKPAPREPSPSRPDAPRPSRVPIALLSLRTTQPFESIRALVPPDALIARMNADGYIVAFPRAASIDGGLQAALSLGKRALTLAQDIVAHVAPLTVRESARGVMVLGPALDQVDVWAPKNGADKLTFSPEAAAILGDVSIATSATSATNPNESRKAGSHSGGGLDMSDDASGTSNASWSESLTTDVTPPLRGRDSLLAALRADAETCLAGSIVVTTLLGEIGHGKTRILDELSQVLTPHFSCVLRASVSAPERNDPESSSKSLIRIAFDLPEQASLDAIQVACEARLGSIATDILVNAVAYTLGAVDESNEVVARLLTTPGSLRRTVGRAIGLGLRQRAENQSLALLIDDAHWAAPQVLDALEIATLSDNEASLFVVVTAGHSLTAQRPGWGDRAARHVIHELPPLDDDAMAVLVRDLLQPIEFVPAAVVDALVRSTNGIPMNLVEMVHALRVGRKIRRRANGEYYLAADELVSLSVTSVSERLSRRVIEALAPALREIAEIASVLGVDVDVDDLAAIQQFVDRVVPAFASDESMDARIGLERLARDGLLVAPDKAQLDKNRYSFRRAMMREAIEALIAPRRRRVYHEAAYRHLSAQSERRFELLPRLARHAAAAGMAEPAANAYLELAEQATHLHRYVDAERHYTIALSLLTTGRDGERKHALAGRSKVRTVLERYDDALEDVQQARVIAEAKGDKPVLASLLLDESTLQDFRNDWPASAVAMERAEVVVNLLSDERLEARLAAALGRTRVRQVRYAEAAVAFRRAIALAMPLGDLRTQTEVVLMLSYLLIVEGKIEESERAFADVIAICERAGDRFHLMIAHNNRMMLWVKTQNYARALADQQITMSIARELGNSLLEASALQNIAELLYLMGSASDALGHTRRAAKLFRRLHGRLMYGVALAAARIEAENGNRAEALALLDEIRANPNAETMTDATRALMRFVEIIANEPRANEFEVWDEVIETLRPLSEMDECIDAAYHAAARALRAGLFDEARRRIEKALGESLGPLWRARFEVLASSMRRQIIPYRHLD